jgi:hypothetical protein
MSDEKPVRFRIVDETGSPVEGAFVSVLRSTVAFPEIALVTDGNGIVQLSLPEGRYVIGANATGERHGEVEVDSGKNSLKDDIVLTIRPGR